MNRRDADRAAFEVTQDLDMVNRDGDEANRDYVTRATQQLQYLTSAIFYWNI